MTIGRLTGDAIVRRLGATRVIVIGGALATTGMLLATLLPAWETALLGYALVGAVNFLFTTRNTFANDHHIKAIGPA